MKLNELATRFSICRLAPNAAVPEPMRGGRFASVTRTSKELSVVCESDRVPAEVRSEAGWTAFEVAGPLAFDLTGIVFALSAPIAESQIGIFVISTFDTDYLLVKEQAADRAVSAWRAAGHDVRRRAGAEELGR